MNHLSWIKKQKNFVKKSFHGQQQHLLPKGTFLPFPKIKSTIISEQLLWVQSKTAQFWNQDGKQLTFTSSEMISNKRQPTSQLIIFALLLPSLFCQRFYEGSPMFSIYGVQTHGMADPRPSFFPFEAIFALRQVWLQMTCLKIKRDQVVYKRSKNLRNLEIRQIVAVLNIFYRFQ